MQPRDDATRIDLRMAARARRWFVRLVPAILSLLPPFVAASGRADDSSVDARRILEASAAALREVRAVEYDFVFGGPSDPSGWATGRTRMQQVTDPTDSRLHVRGVVHAQPRFGVFEQRFDYAVDGRLGYLLDHTAETFQRAPIGVGGNSLSLSAIYGFITEFVESDPLWKELRHSTAARLQGSESIDGVVCDVVRVEAGRGAGANVTTWWIGQGDRLPRKGEWQTVGSSSPPLVMEFRSLTSGHVWSIDDFKLHPPAGYETRRVEIPGGLGKSIPDLPLTTETGDVVRLSELEGRVLVLDFWNTWCYICRTQTPAIARLAAELGDPTVRFFGVNVFETGDPIAYWREQRYPHPTLLEGDDLARALDLPYQPGIAVVDATGKVIFQQLGGTHDRAEKVRRAITAAKAAAR